MASELDQTFKKSLTQAAKDLDWCRYRDILVQYLYYCQSINRPYLPWDTLLYQVVSQNPTLPEKMASQVELIRHLILNQALDLSGTFIFYRAILTGSLTAVKMLLAAGCTITALDLSTLLYRIKSGSDSDVAKAVFLIEQDHLDFNLILFDDVVLDDDECSIVDRIYDLDIDKLNRTVVSQGIDVPQDNVKWYQSGNLAKLLRELGVLVD